MSHTDRPGTRPSPRPPIHDPIRACCLRQPQQRQCMGDFGHVSGPDPDQPHTRPAGCPADFLVPQSDAEDDGFLPPLRPDVFPSVGCCLETRNYLPAARPRGISSPDSQPQAQRRPDPSGPPRRASHPRVPIPNIPTRRVRGHPPEEPPQLPVRRCSTPRPDGWDGRSTPRQIDLSATSHRRTEEKEAGDPGGLGWAAERAPRLTHPRGCLGAEVDGLTLVAVLFPLVLVNACSGSVPAERDGAVKSTDPDSHVGQTDRAVGPPAGCSDGTGWTR